MEKRKYDNKLEKLRDAYNKLQEVINTSNKTEYFEDAVIQRFEFTFELLWKTLKEVLEYNLLQTNNTPKEVFKNSFLAGYIEDEEKVELMFYDRNLTTHLYSQEASHQIFLNIIQKHVFELEKIILKIEEM